MSKLTFVVLREMQGDRDYKPGDTRELTAADAKHLVGLGVLREATADEIAAAQATADAAPEPAADPAAEPAPVIAKIEPPAAAKVEPPATPKSAKRKR